MQPPSQHIQPMPASAAGSQQQPAMMAQHGMPQMMGAPVQSILPPYRQDIVPPDMHLIYERMHYSPAVRVGNLLHISGQVGRDADYIVVPVGDPPTEEGMERQFIQCFENVKQLLHCAGADFADVYQLETYFTDMQTQIIPFMRVKDRYFVGPTYPIWTGYGVNHFSTPGIICEIKCSAVLKQFPTA